jgi:endonuclease/exonuclease/phosphatase (EEP) superfamily protein YafD
LKHEKVHHHGARRGHRGLTFVRILRRGVAAVLTLVLFVLLVAFALRWIDVPTPEIAAVQAVFPVIGAGVLAVTLLALVCRFRRLALLGALPSAVVVVLAVTSLGLTPTPTATADPVTVVSSNLEFGGGNAADVMAAVRDQAADVVVLVEVTPEAVARLKSAGLEQQLPYVVGHPEAGTTGAVIRSRWPLTLLDQGKGVGGSLFWEPYARVERPAGAFRVKAIHTRQPIVSARGWHDDLDRIGQWQRAQPTAEPLILAGDFNASQAHPAFRSMAEALTDAHRATGGGWVRTWPQGRRVPRFVQLDHILVRDLQPVEAGVVPVRGTDHAAVWSTVQTSR